MIAHQKETLSSKETRNHDVMSLGKEKFDELVLYDYPGDMIKEISIKE